MPPLTDINIKAGEKTNLNFPDPIDTDGDSYTVSTP